MSSVGWIENPLKLPYIANNPAIREEGTRLRSTKDARSFAIIFGRGHHVRTRKALSAEAKAKIAEAQRKRWAKTKRTSGAKKKNGS